MKRRTFIRYLSVFSAGLLLSFNRLFGKNELTGNGQAIWLELLDYARWCPSPHNVQPWKIMIVSKTEARLYYDPLRVPFVVDDHAKFTIAGMGMFIQCLMIAASPLGYKVTAIHEPVPQMDNMAKAPKLFAKLYLAASDGNIPIDRELIKKRRTSRLHYNSQVISQDLIKDFHTIANKYGHTFFHTADEELIHYIINLNTNAELLRSKEKDTVDEMCKWVRTTDEDAYQTKDGLWYRCMDTTGKLMYNFFYHPQRYNSGWKKDLTRKMLNKKMQGTANFAWITGNFENRGDWVQSGMMLQELWLQMTKHNVYLHPLGTIITTNSAKEVFKNKIGYDEKNGTLWFLMRLGYSEEPQRSLRLDIKDLLMD